MAFEKTHTKLKPHTHRSNAGSATGVARKTRDQHKGAAQKRGPRTPAESVVVIDGVHDVELHPDARIFHHGKDLQRSTGVQGATPLWQRTQTYPTATKSGLKTRTIRYNNDDDR